MIQQFLTQTIEVLFVGSIAFFTAEFIRFSMARRKDSTVPGQLSLFDDVLLTDSEVEQLQQHPIAPVEPAKPIMLDVVVPFKRPAPKLPDLSGMSIRQLKKLASERKIKRYNIMTKSQLVEAIAAA